MTRILITQLSCVIALVALSFNVTAQNNVVVVPLFGDDAPTSPSPRTIFLTSTVFDGNLGGVDGADAKCQAAATAGELAGVFKAYIGEGFGFEDVVPERSNFSISLTPYLNTNGEEVFPTALGIFNGDGDLQNTILDEFGTSFVVNTGTFSTSVFSREIWTGLFRGGGNNFGEAESCTSFTSNEGDGFDAIFIDESSIGDGLGAGIQFFFRNADNCAVEKSLLCMQQ